MSRNHAHHHDENDHSHDDRKSSSRLLSSMRSLFNPHSHDTLDAVDKELIASDEGMRALKISFAILALTATVELLTVAMSGSVALLGDTIHNFADALSAVPLGLAFWLGRKPANDRYTYGYGRVEDMAGVAILVIIATTGVVTIDEAIHRLVHPQSLHHLGLVIVAGAVGYVGNEFVARYRIRIGKKIGSAALVADGLHARTDAFTSLAVVAAAIGVAVGLPAADPVMGLLITVVILNVLRTAGRDMVRRLMDRVDPELVHHVTTVIANVDGVVRVSDVRLRRVGHELRAQVVIVSDGHRSLIEAHTIAEVAHHQLLREAPRLTKVCIHSDPDVTDQSESHHLTSHHTSKR